MTARAAAWFVDMHHPGLTFPTILSFPICIDRQGQVCRFVLARVLQGRLRLAQWRAFVRHGQHRDDDRKERIPRRGTLR